MFLHDSQQIGRERLIVENSTGLIFISFSGRISKMYATALHMWLPHVIQGCKVFLSEADIPAGKDWRAELFKNLKDASAGILCLTRDNVNERWLYYEAGAMGALLNPKKPVIPLLFDIPASSVPEPLGALQARAATRDNIKSIVVHLGVSHTQASAAIYEAAVDTHWSKLESAFEKISPMTLDDDEPAEITNNDLYEMLHKIYSKLFTQNHDIQQALNSRDEKAVSAISQFMGQIINRNEDSEQQFD